MTDYIIRESWPKPLEAYLAYGEGESTTSAYSHNSAHPNTGARPHASHHPNKRLGQHFLTEPRVLDATIKAAAITSADTVVEIGAGCGILTERLLAHAGNVIAIEIDAELVAFLQDYFAPDIATGKLTILAQDARLFKPDAHVASRAYKIVGNIPYYLTSPLVTQVLSYEQRPESITFLIQREVADRICAAPGEMSILGLLAQLESTAEIVIHVPKQDFYPAPKVESAVIKLTPFASHANPNQLTAEEKIQLIDLAKQAFSKKRKTLVNGLESDTCTKEWVRDVIDAAGLEQQMRPQDLSVEQWMLLTRAWSRATMQK